MKQLYLLLFILFLGGYQAKAALPGGTVAPDWTLTDLNGNTHHLHDILNSGKHVVIDFSATWCGPCWSYHNTHTLANLWNLYGPNGTDEIMVFFIEGDVSTTTPCLYGPSSCSGGTQGNWVAGTPYPIIDLQSPQVRIDYQISYWPTLYAIRAQDKRVFEMGQVSQSQWESMLFQSFEMEYTSNTINNTCRGNGEVSLDLTGGAGTINYFWSNGGQTSTISDLQAGTYSCWIMDANNYFIETEDFEITGVPDLELELLEQTNVSCFGEYNGVLEVGASGGGGGYDYSWDNGSNNARIENLPAGLYTVSLIDIYNCNLELSFEVTEPTALFGTSYPADAPCNNDGGYVELVGLFGTPPYLYDMGGTPQEDPFFYNLQQGTYEYRVTDDNGCTYSADFEIEQVPGPLAVASTQGELSCTNFQVTVSGNGSATGQNITYLWSTQNGHIVSGGNTLNAIVDASGSYTLRVTNISNNCFTEVSTVVASNADLPIAMVADPNPLTCILTETALDGTGSSQGDNYTYLWTTQNGNILSGESTLMPLVDAPGDYVLQVTNTTNGCVRTTSKTLEENLTAPALFVTDGEITCTLTSVELCGTIDAGVQIIWQVGEDEISAECISVSQEGTYVATAIGENGCTTERTATVTASADLPQVTLSTPGEVTCIIQEITLLATLVGNPEDYTITWTTQNGNIVSGENTLTPVVDKGGSYQLSVVNNANGCTTLRTTLVNEDTEAPVSAFNHVQNGEDLVLTSSVEGTVNSYLWDLGNGTTSTEEAVTLQYPATGTYTICLTVTNDCGEDMTCIEVLYVAKLGIQITSSNVKCFDGNDGAILVIPSGGLPDYAIVWDGPNGFTSDQFELTGLVAGIYTGILTDAQGTVIEISHEIIQAPQITQTSVEIINDVNSGNQGSVTPAIAGGTGNYTYLWSNGSTGDKLDKIGAGTYMLTITDENGCSKVFGPYVVGNSTNAIDLTFVQAIQITPNPASDKVVVKVDFVKPVQGATLSVYNAMGQLVTQSLLDNTHTKTINVSQMAYGLYTVEIRSGKQTATKKLVVIH